MREIKFRGKTSTGKWVYGYYCKDYHGIAHIVTLDTSDMRTVHPATIGQYTGLKDKDGNMIFEGDIIKLDDDVVSEITYQAGGFQMITNPNQCKSPCYQDRVKRFTVIGNIHDQNGTDKI